MRNAVAAVAGVVIGVWLMAAPAVLDYAGGAATSDRIVGPTAVAAAWIAAAKVTRSVRWINVVLGAWVLLSAAIFGRTALEGVHAGLAGIGLIVTALAMDGMREDEFGGGWRSLFER